MSSAAMVEIALPMNDREDVNLEAELSNETVLFEMVAVSLVDLCPWVHNGINRLETGRKELRALDSSHVHLSN